MKQLRPTQPHANINFVTVYAVEDLPTLEGTGLIGLSPQVSNSSSVVPQHDSIIEKFFESGSINKKMFSMYLG